MTYASLLPRLGSRVLALAMAVACGGGQAPAPAPAPAGVPAASAGQLNRFAALKVMVLPAQAVVGEDRLGWRTAAGGDKALLAAVDSGIEAQLGGRGLATIWIFPPALQRAARRNPTYLTDPATMRALDPIRVALRKPNEPLAEPFASQLRALAGVSDSRYAFVPLELRFEPMSDGTAGRALLRSAIVDARGAQVVWVGEVAGDPLPAYAPAALASLVLRVADLVVPR